MEKDNKNTGYKLIDAFITLMRFLHDRAHDAEKYLIALSTILLFFFIYKYTTSSDSNLKKQTEILQTRIVYLEVEIKKITEQKDSLTKLNSDMMLDRIQTERMYQKLIRSLDSVNAELRVQISKK